MLINKKYLKEKSPIPLNYNLDELMNYVSVAERIWVYPILGDEFVEELQEQIDENNLSDENATLLVEILWQYLAFATVLEGLPMIWTNVSEVGITKGHSDNSESVSLKDMTYIEQHIRRQVEVLKDQLIDYLETHLESFPLYHSQNCSCNKCCNKNGKLNTPNPIYGMYGTRHICTDLK